MRLIDAIKEGKLYLTEREKICLNRIRQQGSFFEESGGNEEVRDFGSAFLGWYIGKPDVDYKFNPSGCLASLSKKGVLEIADGTGDGDVGYWIKYELDFDKYDNIIFEEV